MTFFEKLAYRVRPEQNAEGEFFEEDRLKDLLWDNSSRHASGLHSRVLDAVKTFAGNAPQFDDITLVVVKRQTLEE